MTSPRPDRLVRMAHVVGDFGNPFYAEERQRDVWNEASAFGFQLVIWITLAVGTATVWVVGAAAVPYVGTALVLLGLICGLTVAYAQQLGVDLTGREHMARWRMLPYTLLVVGLVLGMLRAQAEPLEASTLAGMATGAAVGVLLAVVALRRRSRDT
jgi:carbon starvation protein CstA